MLGVSELAPAPDFSEWKDLMPDLGKSKREDYRRTQVTQAEIKESFHDGWRINYIRQATLEAIMDHLA